MTLSTKQRAWFYSLLVFGPQIFWGIPFGIPWKYRAFHSDLADHGSSIQLVTAIQFIFLVKLLFLLARSNSVPRILKVTLMTLLCICGLILILAFYTAPMVDGFV